MTKVEVFSEGSAKYKEMVVELEGKVKLLMRETGRYKTIISELELKSMTDENNVHDCRAKMKDYEVLIG